jgi:hypothetical protein
MTVCVCIAVSTSVSLIAVNVSILRQDSSAVREIQVSLRGMFVADQVLSMVDTKMMGMRCRALREVRSHQGVVKRLTLGTIQHFIENYGRHLVSVHWDSGFTAYVFPAEIEILDGDDPYGSPA